MANKPVIDFIGIGAQKAGTSWLYYCLKQLPEFSVPPIKELHYFDRSVEYPSPNKLAETSLINRLLQPDWNKKALKTIIKHSLKGDLKSIKWYAKWSFSSYTDDWYLSLFSSFDGLKGEISPSYSILKEKDIARMYSIAPDAKLIFIIRNPVYRVWSHYQYDTQRAKNKSSKSDEIKDIITFIDSEGQELRSNYIRTLENYSRIYPKNQILLCFYDAIKDNPLLLLNHIVDFIGGNPDNVSKYCSVSKKINTTKKVDMPAEIFDYLKKKYYSQIKQLAKEYGSYCNKWYKDLYIDNSIKEDKVLLPATTIG